MEKNDDVFISETKHATIIDVYLNHNQEIVIKQEDLLSNFIQQVVIDRKNIDKIINKIISIKKIKNSGEV